MRAKLGLGLEDGTGSAGAASTYLDSVLDSVVFELDATQTDSYPGSGSSWLNLIASPADGETQATYDFPFSGTPVFNGTPGDTGAYWGITTGNRFQLSSNTTFTGNLHKVASVGPFWIAATFYAIDATWGGGVIVSTKNSTGNGLGVTAYLLGSRSLSYNQSSGAAGTGFNSGFGSLAAPGEELVIMSFDPANEVATYWINSTTGTGVAFVYTVTTNAAEGAFTIGELTTSGTPLVSSDWRLRTVACGNEYLDDTKVASLVSNWEARHGRDYTP